jgi:hypothetical protein
MDTLTLLAPLAPYAIKALSAIFSIAENVSKTQENLEETQYSLSDLRNMPPDDLIKVLLDLRSSSFDLFDGLDLFSEELDEALGILRRAIEAERKELISYREESLAVDSALD